jgi:hypothetical protein
VHLLIAQAWDNNWELVVLIGFASLAVMWLTMRYVFPTEGHGS